MTTHIPLPELEYPVVQAGLGGGVAGPELAGAVSAAGGLGTVATFTPSALVTSLRDARRRAPGRPVAANLLTPFVRRRHVDACVEGGAALVVLHGGTAEKATRRLRAAGLPVLHTVGTPEQARRSLSLGVDGLVVQGIEAGGHNIGVESVDHALARVLEVAGEDVPVLAAGGVAEADDVRRLVGAGATAAIAGTRFLLTDESRAHPLYQRRVLEADRTLATLLFGIGWPLLHRVVPNAATDRWCRGSELGPAWVRAIGRLSAPTARVLPVSAVDPLAALQRSWLPLLSPALPLRGMSDASVDRTALYAGETIHRLHDIIPAAEAVARLAGVGATSAPPRDGDTSGARASAGTPT